MRIEFERVRQGPVPWCEELVVDARRLDRPEVEGLSAIRCEGEISYADPGFRLQGELSYQQTLVCFRCLEPLVEPVKSSIELLILPPGESTPGEERRLEEGDMIIVHWSGKELDTEPLVLEQLQLNLPMKPLCSPDCRGLCPHCGRELNRSGDPSCDCREAEVDPRWGGLKALRERLPS